MYVVWQKFVNIMHNKFGVDFRYEAKNSVQCHDVASLLSGSAVKVAPWHVPHNMFFKHQKWKAQVTFSVGVNFHGCNSIIEWDIQVWKLKFLYKCYHWPRLWTSWTFNFTLCCRRLLPLHCVYMKKCNILFFRQ